ncbi:hypothetical protein J0S82_014483, partial [Galemys pyrenaicus]
RAPSLHAGGSQPVAQLLSLQKWAVAAASMAGQMCRSRGRRTWMLPAEYRDSQPFLVGNRKGNDSSSGTGPSDAVCSGPPTDAPGWVASFRKKYQLVSLRTSTSGTDGVSHQAGWDDCVPKPYEPLSWSQGEARRQNSPEAALL